MLEKLPPRQREILTMLRQGETHRAIAHKLGLHEKTIRRLLQRVAPEFLADDVAERSGSFEPDGLDAAS
jgi:DNA-directed RNA polymerase specialized sigma24 family protein